MTTYVIRVGGSLSDELVRTFPELMASVQSVSTVLQGDLPDQTALNSVLDQLDELGVQIIDVTSLPKPAPRETEPAARTGPRPVAELPTGEGHG